MTLENGGGRKPSVDKKPLTPTQRRILLLLLEHGSAAFTNQQGRVGFDRSLGVFDGQHGLVIEAYQTPELFLTQRGLVERVQSNRPGQIFKLTENGWRRAAALDAKRKGGPARADPPL